MRIYLLLSLFLISMSSSYAQEMHDPVAARNHIRALKSSTLLVRLQTRSKAINALRERNRDQEADAIEAEQKEKNLKIVQAFRAEFDFCPVLFFYSDDSKYVLERNWVQVSFLDENLNADSQIKFKDSSFYMAEFTQVDTRVDKSEGTPELGFNALVIKDSEFNQLDRPFPYYVRDFDSLPIRRKALKVVRKMNGRLKNYLSSN